MQENTFKEDQARLIQAILSLENAEECEIFFDDLLTIQELHAISQRIKVATLLKQGMTCQKIATKTKASTATISRVNKCINYGKGGYDIILNRIKEGE